VGVSERHLLAFEEFHRANPHVYERLKRLAFRLKVRGVQRWGIKALYEVLRFEEAVATSASAGTYRLNNNFTALYARKLMEAEPDLEGFFELRERRRLASE
jgi:hypothetical protein